MPTKYKLTYFNAKGRAEITRLLFAVGGISFEDCRIQKEDWLALKPNTPWGTLPILEVDGLVLGQSVAIARFVAKELGLAGKNNIEQAKCDAIVDACSELVDKAIAVIFESDANKKEQLQTEFKEKKLPTLLASLAKILKENNGGTGWFVGDSITWADVCFFNIMTQDMMTGGNKDCLKTFPLLDDLIKRVHQHPKIATYLKDRPGSQF